VIVLELNLNSFSCKVQDVPLSIHRGLFRKSIIFRKMIAYSIKSNVKILKNKQDKTSKNSYGSFTTRNSSKTNRITNRIILLINCGDNYQQPLFRL
jgi:hypothetical protein